MASNINPYNIDGSYPVAGQDNNSQGFRDNFTNIRTNFGYAKDEIVDLQNKVVLKAALQGMALDNNMGGSSLSNAVFQNIANARTTLSANLTELTVDYIAGPCFTLDLRRSVIISFANWPSGPNYGEVRVIINPSISTNYTVTFTSLSSWVNATGIEGCTVSGSNATIKFPVAGANIFYEFVISTTTGGTTLTINESNKLTQPFNNSKELLANSSTASLGVTTSYFQTVTPSTCVVPAGIEGKVKILAMYDYTGDMVVTVANAGWAGTGSGTITFSDIGQTATLMYINDKWFCIGVGPGSLNTVPQLS